MGLIDDIKREAAGNRTKIQGSEAAALEKILNNLFYLDKNIEEEIRKTSNDERIGISRARRIACICYAGG